MINKKLRQNKIVRNKKRRKQRKKGKKTQGERTRNISFAFQNLSLKYYS